MPQGAPAAAAAPAPVAATTTAPAQQSAPAPSFFVPSLFQSDAAPESGWGKDQYIVTDGDTLSEIAERYQIEGGWPALYELNRDVIEDPDLIYPGQAITLRLL